MSVNKRNTSLMWAFCFLLSLVITVFPVNASANNAVYENAFNIQAALDYAKQWARNPETLNPEDDYHNPEYKRYDADCTNFVSQCLVASGLQQDSKWTANPDDRDWQAKVDRWHPFTFAPHLLEYLVGKGYSAGKAEFWGRHGVISETSLRPSAGDIVQFDWGGGDGFSHSVLCMGEDADGVLKFASHTSNRFDQEFTVKSDCDPSASAFAVIYMTDTRGMDEVTSEFAGKYVTIKSNEVNRYVYADENGAFANRYNAPVYQVVRGAYGAVGFRAPNGKFLCTDLNAGDSRYAPLVAKYQDSNVLTWESFRIFRKGSDYYIQSQATGKWVQAVASGDANHTVRAAAREASTWERFSISACIDGEFFIRSTVTENAAQMLDVYYGENSAKYAKNVQIYGFNAGNNQKFRITHVGNGWHQIQVATTGKVLDVEGGTTNVIVWDSHGGDNQCWRFVPDGDGFRIQSKLGYFLDVSGGYADNETNVQVYEGNGTAAQHWRLYKASDRNLYTT